MTSRPVARAVLLVAVAAIMFGADGTAQLTKPPTRPPTVIADPATLTATGGPPNDRGSESLSVQLHHQAEHGARLDGDHVGRPRMGAGPMTTDVAPGTDEQRARMSPTTHLTSPTASRGTVPRLTLATLLLGLGSVAPLAAQRLPKPEFTRNPTVLLAPAWVSAYRPNIIPSPYLKIEFNSVANAAEYRISRAADDGPETVIFQGTPSTFVYLGSSCVPGSPIPGQVCSYFDRSIKPSVIYTYWVRTIYNGGVASPPSRPATAHRTQ